MSEASEARRRGWEPEGEWWRKGTREVEHFAGRGWYARDWSNGYPEAPAAGPFATMLDAIEHLESGE